MYCIFEVAFSNVRSVDNVNIKKFNRYCLRPAIKMRRIIKRQLGILDIEYRGKDVPKFSVKDVRDES